MQEELDILQRIARGTPDVGSDAHLPKRGAYAGFVELTVNPCHVPEAGGGQRLRLVVIVVEQSQVEILRLLPVAVAVQGAPHHGSQGAADVIALQSCPHISRVNNGPGHYS